MIKTTKKNRLKININAKKYYYKNKDKISKNHGIYRKNNKEKINNYLKNYNEINKEIIRDKKKIYYQTDNGKKVKRIIDWKKIGLICEDYDALYEKVYNTTNC